MNITSEQLRMILQNTWPNLTQIWITDPVYEVISVKKLDEIIKVCSVAHLEYIDGIWDCDNFALQRQAKVQKYQYDEFKKGKAGSIPWAFGECMGMKFRGHTLNHDINICLTDEGIYLSDPQRDDKWKGSTNNDSPYFNKF